LYGWRLAGQSPQERLRRAARVAESLGKLIGRMHAWQIAHGDLKASNLLIVDREEKPQSYLIDAEDVRITHRLTSAQRRRDLARLATSLDAHPWVTPTILRRFLRTYLRQLPEKSLDWKRLWRAVSRRTDRLIRRKRRRHQPVL
ncbi:MAG: phosphotransferase, partial [Planctomycetes bacterium]|nr:phosphotransferase [Planctomycetota bacterium]